MNFIKVNREDRKNYQQKVTENMKKTLSVYNEDSKKHGFKVLKAKGPCKRYCFFNAFESYDWLCDHKCRPLSHFSCNEFKRYLANLALLEQMKAFVEARAFLEKFYSCLAPADIQIYSDKFDHSRAALLQLVGKTFWGNASMATYRKQLHYEGVFDLLNKGELVSNNLNINEVWNFFYQELEKIINQDHGLFFDSKSRKYRKKNTSDFNNLSSTNHFFKTFFECLDRAMKDLSFPGLDSYNRFISLTNVLIDIVVYPLFYSHASKLDIVNRLLLKTEEEQKAFFANTVEFSQEISEKSLENIKDLCAGFVVDQENQQALDLNLEKALIKGGLESSYLIKKAESHLTRNFYLLSMVKAMKDLVHLGQTYELSLKPLLLLISQLVHNTLNGDIPSLPSSHFDVSFVPLKANFLWIMLSENKDLFERALAIEQNSSKNESKDNIVFQSEECLSNQNQDMVKNKTDQENVKKQHEEVSKFHVQLPKGENRVLKLFWKIYQFWIQFKDYLFSLMTHIWASA
ncbi:hypothetical protein IPH67_03445 [bacterium]|nr:MAG: hypothetical protein IPH67_03445 [bacterium]